MNNEDDWGHLAKLILFGEVLIAFLVITALIFNYGIFPAFEYIGSLIELSDYQRGVIDTLVFLFFVLIGLYVSFSGPRRSM